MYKISTSGYFKDSRVGYIHVFGSHAGSSLDSITANYLREHDECSIIHIAIIEKEELNG
jgi:hypothetical protein